VSSGYIPKSLADVMGYLEELSGLENARDLFIWEEREGVVYARLKGYLGDRRMFASLAQAFREMGGTYVSAGKESHFKVELKAPKRDIQAIIADFYALIKELEAWARR